MAIGYVPEEALAVLLGLMAFQSLAVGGELVQDTSIADPVEPPDGLLDIEGWFSFMGDLLSKGLGLVELLGKLVTFSALDGMPGWIRVPLAMFATTITGILGFQIGAVIAEALGTLIGGIIPG